MTIDKHRALSSELRLYPRIGHTRVKPVRKGQMPTPNARCFDL